MVKTGGGEEEQEKGVEPGSLSQDPRNPMRKKQEKGGKRYFNLRLITILGPQGMPRGLVLMQYRRARE